MSQQVAGGSKRSSRRSRRPHPAQLLAGLIGLGYLGAGVLGFFITGFENFASHTGETLLGFEINPLHNIVHLVVGLTGIALAPTLPSARVYGWLLAVGYGATLIYGLAAVQNEDLNVLSLNVADNWLHGVSATLGLVIAAWPSGPRE